MHGEAFAQIAGEQATRVEALHPRPHRGHALHIGAEYRRDHFALDRNPPRRIEQRDQLRADQPVERIAEAEAKLLVQMLAQRAAARRQILHAALRSVRATAAAELGAEQRAVGVEGVGPVGIEGCLLRQLVGGDQGGGIGLRREGFRLGTGTLVGSGQLGRLGVPIVALEQRIALELLLDEGCDVEVGKLQQLERLLHLRGHRKRLRLAQVDARTDPHGGRQIGRIAALSPPNGARLAGAARTIFGIGRQSTTG